MAVMNTATRAKLIPVFFFSNTDYMHLLESSGLKGLSRLAIFENFNQQYACAFPVDCSPTRPPNSALSEALFQVSHNLESLSASFMADASDFFSCCVWIQLEIQADLG